MTKNKKRMESENKSRRGRVITLIVLATVTVLVVAYIIYAMSIADDSDLKTLESEAIYLETQSPGIILNDAATKSIELDTAPTLDNPVKKAMGEFDNRWKSALDTMRNVQDQKDLSYAFLAMEIYYADIMQDVLELASIDLNLERQSIGVEPPIWEDTNNPGKYTIKYRLSNQNLISGEIDSSSNSLYYTIQSPENATVLRATEIVNQGKDCFIKLISTDGPYAGEAYFMISDDGEIRAVIAGNDNVSNYIPNEMGIYFNQPVSWEEIRTSGNDFFSATNEDQIESTQILDIGGLSIDSAAIDSGAIDNTTTDSAAIGEEIVNAVD